MASPLLRNMFRKLYRAPLPDENEEDSIHLSVDAPSSANWTKGADRCFQSCEPHQSNSSQHLSIDSAVEADRLGEMGSSATFGEGRNKPLPPLPHEENLKMRDNLEFDQNSSQVRDADRATNWMSITTETTITEEISTPRSRRFSVDQLTDTHPDDVFVDNLSSLPTTPYQSEASEQDEHINKHSHGITRGESEIAHDYRNDPSVWFASSRWEHRSEVLADDPDESDQGQKFDNNAEGLLNPQDATGLIECDFQNHDSEGDSPSQTRRDSGNDFFSKYFDAMENGTEHSWTVALCQSDLSDKALADAYLSNLPKKTLQRHFQSSDTRASSYTAAMNSSQDLYSFGNSPASLSRQPGLRARKPNLPELELSTEEDGMIVPHQLSPIHEERESIASLSSLVETPVSTPTTPNTTRAKKFSKCDACGSTSPTHNIPCKKLEDGRFSGTMRQKLLLQVLAAAAKQLSPFHFIYKSFQTQEFLANNRAVGDEQPKTLRTDTSVPPLGIVDALRAVIKTVRDYQSVMTNVKLDENGMPVKHQVLHASIGKLALVATAVLALEAATSQAEGGVGHDVGLILAAKTAGAKTREFCNRVFEILAIFRATNSNESPKADGAALGVLTTCANAVDDEMWKLWQQMHGGIDESGRRISDSIHWDVMVEVAREAIAFEFIDVRMLAPMREAVDKVAGLKWMQG